jgi:hypothetical protein
MLSPSDEYVLPREQKRESTVTPKLFYCRKEARQIPVWEIVNPKGHRYYYERVHIDGYIPIGIQDTFKLGGINCSVCSLVRYNRKSPPEILRVDDGYRAPMGWYRKDMGW